MSICLRWDGLKEAHHRRGYATVETAVGGGQLRGEAGWGYRTRRSGARRAASTNASRGMQLPSCY